MIKFVDDIMTEKVITVTDGTAVSEAALILAKHSFNGLPVVDKNGKLIGLFTEHNLISDKSYVHLRTMLKLFSQLKFYKKDKSPIQDELKEILNLQVKDVMTPKPTTVHPNDSLETVSQLFSNPANNPLPVVDGNGKLRGILSLSDLTRLYGVANKNILDQKDVDKKIDEFVNKFEEEFLVVTKFRASTWFIVSVLFTVIGFAIAMFLILRIS